MSEAVLEHRVVTLEDLRAAVLAEVAIEGEEYVYDMPTIRIEDDDEVHERTDCVYVYDGKGSCLLGRAMIRLGVSAERLSREEEWGTSPFTFDQMPNVITEWEFEPDAVDWGGYVQNNQDRGWTWGTSVTGADTALAADQAVTNQEVSD